MHVTASNVCKNRFHRMLTTILYAPFFNQFWFYGGEILSLSICLFNFWSRVNTFPFIWWILYPIHLWIARGCIWLALVNFLKTLCNPFDPHLRVFSSTPVPPPSLAPDLVRYSWSNFFAWFPQWKKALKGKCFADVGEVTQNMAGGTKRHENQNLFKFLTSSKTVLNSAKGKTPW